jgi:3-oxoadipate enol-lactonase
MECGIWKPELSREEQPDEQKMLLVESVRADLCSYQRHRHSLSTSARRGQADDRLRQRARRRLQDLGASGGAAGDAFGYVLFDKRGHGLSELGAAPPTIETFAGDLAALLDHVGVKRAVICGLSIGGPIALCLYETRPDLIDGLIFCDTASKIGTREMWDSRISATLGPGITSFADGVMEKWFTRRFHRDRAAELAGYKTMLSRQSPDGYAAGCMAIRDADFSATAGTINVPAMVVVGDQDGSTPPDIVESLARSIPAARFEIIADAAHIPCVEQPVAFYDLVRAFMAAEAA